jgi:hypothetical protein
MLKLVKHDEKYIIYKGSKCAHKLPLNINKALINEDFLKH